MGKWIVAAACSVINLLLLGNARLLTQLFVASMERYNLDRQEASFPYGLCYFIRTLLGPFIGSLGSKYEIRSLCLIGCLFSFIGVGACYFAEDKIILNIFWGVVFGVGFGFGTSLIPAIIDYSFDEKNKSKAYGLSYAGPSLGGVIVPPLLDHCIKVYGLSGSYLILAGLILHGIPACLLLPLMHSKDSSNVKFTGHGEAERNADSSLQGDKPNRLSVSEERQSTEAEADSINVNTESVKNATCIVLHTSTSVLRRLSKKREVSKEPSSKQISILKTFKIFFDPTFLILGVTQSIYYYVNLTVWTILVDVMRDKGIDRDYEVTTLMLLTVADLIGRCCLGHITDAGYMSTNNFCIVFFVLMGLFAVQFVWVYHLVLVMATIFLFSFVSGGLIAVFPANISEFVIDEYKIMAFSSRSLFMAPLSLTVSPMIGYFRESHGSYDGIFYLCGIISIGCGVVSAAIPSCSQRSRARFKAERFQESS